MLLMCTYVGGASRVWSSQFLSFSSWNHLWEPVLCSTYRVGPAITIVFSDQQFVNTTLLFMHFLALLTSIRHNVHFFFIQMWRRRPVKLIPNNVFKRSAATIIFNKQALNHFLNMKLVGI